MTPWIVCGVIGLVAMGSVIAFALTAVRLRALRQRFATITNADEEAARIIAAANKKLVDAEGEAARIILAGQVQTGGAEVGAARIEGTARANAESESAQVISSILANVQSSSVQLRAWQSGADPSLHRFLEKRIPCDA